MNSTRPTTRLAAGLLAIILALSLTPSAASPVRAASGAVINEFVLNHTGTDTNEYIEIFGDADTDYSSLSVLEIEGDGSGAGLIDGVWQVGTTDTSGFWTTGFLNNELENGTLSLLLVEGFSGSTGDDLDGDNDGSLDSTPWSSIVDDVAVTDGDSTDRTYSSAVLSPGYDGITFTPGGASRYPDGSDTDAAADWVRNDFDLAGIPGFTGTPDLGEAFNTPGAANELVPPPPPPPVVTIMEVQGPDQFSPYDGQVIETSGVVTLFTANGANFWLQDPGGDGDATTSDGIFVAGGGFPAEGPRPSVGDVIRIVALVEEQQFGNDLPLTRLSSVSLIEVLSSGNPLPDPIPLNDLPDESIPNGINFWEPLEGMLVSADNAPVVAATSGFGEFAMLAKDDAKPGSGFYPQTQQILLRSLGDEAVDYNPERILVDDSSLDHAIVVMPGDRVRSLVGAVDYTFGNYKLQPASFDVETHNLPNLPASTRSGPNGDAVITTFNVENLFDLVDEPGKDDTSSTPNPQELETKLNKLATAIQVELELPEILIVQEVENTTILQELGNRVNAAAGTAYVATSFETSDARGIEVGFLWDDNRVDLLDAYQLSGPDVEAAFGPDSPSPGREPLVGVFQVEGRQLTIVGNHFKSKSGDDALFGVNWPPVRVTEVQRKAQARVVRSFVNSILDTNPDALVMVAGDLNDFQFSEPGEGADNPVAILEGIEGGVPMTNLVNFEKDDERYTYIFDGNSEVLDHMLVSPALYDLFAAVDMLHFDAGFPADLSEDPATPLRTSDHDPLEGRFNLK
jgi:predicted extracellular nuclease